MPIMRKTAKGWKVVDKYTGKTIKLFKYKKDAKKRVQKGY